MGNVLRSSGGGGGAVAPPLSSARRRGVLGLLVAGAVLCAYLALIAIGGSSPAYAAPTPPPFLGEVVGSEMPDGMLEPGGLAVDQATGDVYVTESDSVLELAPYGTFVRQIGPQVDKTKVRKREAEEAAKEPVTITQQEEDTCTAASGDECGRASAGIPGEFGSLKGIAVQPSTGAIYVINNPAAGSVVKIASDGSFDWAIGNDVNKTKVEERKREEANSEPVTVSQEEEDICTGSSGDACQSGQRGVTGGLFEQELANEAIAVGGPEERLYVGNKARVQIFDGSGKQVGEDSLSALSASGRPQTFAVSPTGEVFLSDEGVDGVHEIEPDGTLSSNVYGSMPPYRIGSIALDGSGDLYVGQYQSALEYEVANPSAAPTEFGTSGEGKISNASRMAIDPAGTVYLYSGQLHDGMLMFGSLSQMEAAYGAPPTLAPTVGMQSASTGVKTGEARLEAEVNPQLRATTYQFQYGLAPCSDGGCTAVPATPTGLGVITKTLHDVTAAVTGLQSDRIYYLRVLAANAAGSVTAVETAFTPGTAPVAGAPGLPDGRHYELVSPADKHGNFVHGKFLGLTSAEGNEMVYVASGGMGSAPSSVPGEYLARHSPRGWSTSGAVPPQVGAVSLLGGPEEFIPSQSFSKFLFMARFGSYTKLEPLGPSGSVNVFEWSGSSPEATWLGQPLIENPSPAPGYVNSGYFLAGASPELNHVYFTYSGTLVPEDAPRAVHTGEGYNSDVQAWGFYEWNAGHLEAAGLLPSGTMNPYGAVAASFAGYSGFTLSDFGFQVSDPEVRGNEVSSNGRTAFFVSPDPLASEVTDKQACEAHPGACTREPPQLYARETSSTGAKRTVLVSRSELPGQEGNPAPDGARVGIAMGGSYVYASPDGSVAFFLSNDQLTSAAPANFEPKAYEFNLETEALTYLPGVTGRILTVAPHGTDFIFENTATDPHQIELWTAATGGGMVRPVAQLPAAMGAGGGEIQRDVRQARVTEDGSVFLFGTKAPVPAGFNNGGGYEQLYRYVVGSGELTCVSCPGSGQAPNGDAEATRADWEESTEENLKDAHSTVLPREMSANGERVFFDSTNALTPQATNGQRDVYEWEDGKVYLISCGSSGEASYVMDSSANGNDVFFGTSAGLVPADTDGAYDVYDARIPHPGDNPPPEAAPCEGAVCQGPPSTPQLLSPPASESFSGPGNLIAPSASGSRHTAKVRKRRQELRRALKRCRSKRNKSKREKCARLARRRYGGKAARHERRHRHAQRHRHRKTHGGKARRHNGRGK